ncbi:hypothetical protein PGT21_022718 [Puccinia graminis f. sp. tritici]|uniref:Uncharacterized protein n=1 Tax=Puccinia graminis f. sp. tritici TaxID=56615 RepID=A0A5B0QYC4_PUCGR|nr:hypothetical protein PGT21_022718 [Puccinia graminis f. sp. tritici]
MTNRMDLHKRAGAFEEKMPSFSGLAARSDNKLHALARKSEGYESLVEKGQSSGGTSKGIICPIRRSNMLKNWDTNQKEVIILEEYSKHLSNFHNQLLLEDFESMKIRRKNIDLVKLSEAKEILEESKKNLSILEQWKLFKLANIDLNALHSQFKEWFISNEKDSLIYQKLLKVPVDMFGLIFDQHLQGLGNVTLEEMKKLITNYDFLWNDLIPGCPFSFPKIREHVREYFFMMVDFLFENEFINPEMVRSLLQDQKIVCEIVHHTATCLGNEIEMKYINWGPNLTEHWYWPHVNKFYSALGKREESIVDFVCLSERIYDLGKSIRGSINQFGFDGWELWEIIFKNHSIAIGQYFRKSKNLKGSDGLENYSGKNSLLHSQLSTYDLKLIEEEMEQTVPLLILKQYPYALSGSNKSYLDQFRPAVFDLLIFYENNLYPGILNKFIMTSKLERVSLVDTPQAHDNEDIVELIILSSECYSLFSLARNYEAIFEKAAERTVFGLSYDESIPKGYISRLHEILPQWKKTYSKVKEAGEEIITRLCEDDKNLPRLIKAIKTVETEPLHKLSKLFLS